MFDIIIYINCFMLNSGGEFMKEKIIDISRELTDEELKKILEKVLIKIINIADDTSE